MEIHVLTLAESRNENENLLTLFDSSDVVTNTKRTLMGLMGGKTLFIAYDDLVQTHLQKPSAHTNIGQLAASQNNTTNSCL